MMNAKEIVGEYLELSGYDGLCLSDRECCCHVRNISPADCMTEKCVPGHAVIQDNGGWIIKPGRKRMLSEIKQTISTLRSFNRWRTGGADKKQPDSSLITKALSDATATLERMDDAIRETLEENRHLADGENCTLWRLKQVSGEEK